VADTTPTSPDLVLAHLDSLPTLPAVALRVLQMTGGQNGGARDLVEVLRGDQSLTAKILSVAGSPAYGAKAVTTLERAVPLLGFAAVRSIVLATGVIDAFARKSPSGAAFDHHEFWKHALAVACAARRCAALGKRDIDPEEAFVAGLLHDLGKVALSTVFPKGYDRAAMQANQARTDIADCERRVLGADHTVAGRRLAERWRLPRELQEAIWLHHIAAEALPSAVAKPRLIALVQLADTLAREQRVGYSGNHLFYESSSQLAGRLGLAEADVQNVAAALPTDVAEHMVRLGLGGETPQEVYVQAMARANSELGRLNAELLASNRRLAADARYYGALVHFEQNLSDWADPAAVVAALAESAAEALQQPGAAAFGLRESGSALDICARTAEASERTRLTRPVSAELEAWARQARAPAAGLVAPLPGALRSVLADVLDRDAPGAAWLLPIHHAGEIAGGVVYQSTADETVRLAEEQEELRAFLASLGLALGRANAQSAARRLSEDLAATNRRLQQMQVELLRSRTLSMIAEMAAGAGHELNGPLTVISGWAQMLTARLRDPEAQRVLKLIEQKAHECSGIVTELMDFARPRTPQLAPLRLADLLRSARDVWLERTAQPASRVRLTLTAGPAEQATVLADAEQMRSVFEELLDNAGDAVAEKSGTITIWYQEAADGANWEVRVEDDGVGMTPAVLQRAFDPFFSHRQAGRGRGLGLPRAYRIVEAHGGRIWLESRPGEGTAAHVVLPSRPAQ
jgi:putative nucleotidyltransferase with HDIG domain